MARLWIAADDQHWPETGGVSAQVSSEPLTEEMLEKCNQRLFAAWLRAPIPELPGQLEEFSRGRCYR